MTGTCDFYPAIGELSLVGRNEMLLAVAGLGVSGGKIDHETNKEWIASFAKVEVLVEDEDNRAALGAQIMSWSSSSPETLTGWPLTRTFG